MTAMSSGTTQPGLGIASMAPAAIMSLQANTESGLVGEQPAHRLVAGLDRELAALDEAGVDLDAVAVQRPFVAHVAVVAVDAIGRDRG